MPSRKSKSTGTRSSRSNAARTCSEAELRAYAEELVAGIRAAKGPRARVILEGPLGAGKSTFARAVLEAFGVRREAEGSPTFAIAHEYLSGEGIRVIHADGYRLEDEADLEATGLLEPLWDPETIVLFEWLDRFDETADALRASGLPVRWLKLGFVEGDPGRRTIEESN